MNRVLRYMALIVLYSSVPTFAVASDITEPRTDFPQAKPVIQMLNAIQNSNAKGLKNAFSMRVQRELEKKYDWGLLLTLYKQVFAQQGFENFQTSEFSFTYKNVDDNFGLVCFYFKGKKIKDAEMRVTREDGVWKLAEK